ncbi:AzlC family ABC transporter permease [Rhizobium halophytocola]|uniref:Branched-subunit amino acid permease n=1 Tax=Rhizobium halophytocola TaxID=735519 RepID=A0ABS4DWB8_9HYPH|nr:AzlC family ABC transporter permease [Rhizobium halophytocola]MBP1849934.1 putative branched-subunit amino acid permease [Rhizobium halophytocola]
MSDILDDRPASYWLLQGMRGLFSIPALILMCSFVGFAAFAFEAGLTRGEAMFMTFSVWALPAAMILTGMLSGGAPLIAIIVAVSLSSIRMMPMVAALVPEIRTKKTSVLILLLCSHVVAITAWVFAMQTVKSVPREHRVIYFLGFGYTLTAVNTLIVGICYGLVAGFPPLVAGALFFLTPVYFIASIWLTSKQAVVRLAYVIGLVSGPTLALLLPGWDILIAGIGGGTLAYLIDRGWRSRRAVAEGGKA